MRPPHFLLFLGSSQHPEHFKQSEYKSAKVTICHMVHHLPLNFGR